MTAPIVFLAALAAGGLAVVLAGLVASGAPAVRRAVVSDRPQRQARIRTRG